MDYLIRDAYYTGVSYGMVDVEHLLRNIIFYDDTMVLKYRGLKSAEALLMSRFLMYPSVYNHHVGRITGAMYSGALESAIESLQLDPFELQLMDDYEINVRMRNMAGYPADIIRRLNDRNLFKRALYVGFDAVDRNIVRYAKAHREIEAEIARLAGVDPGYVIVDIPKVPEFRERNTRVLTENDQLKYIDDVSSMARIVEESYVEDWRMGVYTLPELREQVGRIARDYFNVEKSPKQSKLEVAMKEVVLTKALGRIEVRLNARPGRSRPRRYHRRRPGPHRRRRRRDELRRAWPSRRCSRCPATGTTASPRMRPSESPRRSGCNCAVVAGVHYDNITPQEIKDVLILSSSLMDELEGALRTEGL